MKFIYQSIISLLSISMMLLLFSCSHDHSNGEEHDHGDETSTHSEGDEHKHGDLEEHGESKIHLSQKQIETMDIQFGYFSNIKINDFVKATGTLGLPPNALTSVSAKAKGFIKNSKKYVEGSYVKKGAVMAFLENPAFIQQQQHYLEIAAALVYDRQELSRQQVLLASKAGIEKNVQKLEAEIAIKTATLKGVSKQLSYLGIKIDKLTPDNIVQRIPLYAPMSGYITSIKMHNGMYVTPEMELMEIVNENHLHIELDVFENNIASIKEGQAVSYTIPALGNTIYEGEVNIIGKEFNIENKTVRVHGHLGKERPKFIKDLFLEAKIWLNDQTVQALPESAIIKDGTSSYIYITKDRPDQEPIVFEQIMVIPGTIDKGFVAIKLIDQIPEGAKIVTSGAYYVYAQSKAGELEHEH